MLRRLRSVTAGVAVAQMGRSGGESRTVERRFEGQAEGREPVAHWSGRGAGGRGLGASRKQRDRESNSFAFWALLNWNYKLYMILSIPKEV